MDLLIDRRGRALNRDAAIEIAREAARREGRALWTNPHDDDVRQWAMNDGIYDDAEVAAAGFAFASTDNPLHDQYGDPVPNDLVVLDFDMEELTEAQLDGLDGLDWYAPDDNDGLILVSWEEMHGVLTDEDYGLFDPTDPKDVGCDVSKGVKYIAHPLHRYGPEGFYHA